MNKKIFILAISVLVAGICGIAFSERIAAEDKKPESQIVFIINAESSLKKELKKETPVVLTAKEIKEIYLGKTKFWGKARIVPVNHKDKGIFDAFLKQYVGMTPAAYKEYWVKKVFAEGGSAPQVKENSGNVITCIADNEAGIGYVLNDDLKDNPAGIEAITVDTKTE